MIRLLFLIRTPDWKSKDKFGLKLPRFEKEILSVRHCESGRALCLIEMFPLVRETTCS